MNTASGDVVFLGVLLLDPAGINLGQTALGSFPEPMVQVDAGFVHSPADHIVADIPGAGEEVTQIASVHGSHSRYSISFDARNLHQAANGVTGQAQVMFQGIFRSVFDL